MEKLKISEICSINPRQDDNIPENSEISFIPMAAVSANGQVDLSDTLESSKVKNYTLHGERKRSNRSQSCKWIRRRKYGVYCFKAKRRYDYR